MHITLEQTSGIHPGRVSADDISELSFRTPAGGDLNLQLKPHFDKEGHTRRDAGATIILITFICGTIGGEILKETGKDIYAWVKRRLATTMEKKRKSTSDSGGDYRFHPPEWQLRIQVGPEEFIGLTATISARTSEMMINGAEAFVHHLEAEASEMDLSHGMHTWRATETSKGICIEMQSYES